MGAAKRSGNRTKKRPKARILPVAGIAAGIIALFAVYKVFGPNTGGFTDGTYLYIRTGSSYEQVKQTLDTAGFIRDMLSFDLLARRLQYPRKVRAGKYRITKGMSNYQVIRMLRSGRQTPVRLVINKLRTKNDFIRFVSTHLEADSQVMRQMFSDNVYLSQFGLDTNSVMCSIIPDTYEFYWNTTADRVFRKIQKNYTALWNETRKNAARDKGLSIPEACTIASIVDEETNNDSEKPDIASVYLNRLSKGMKLQADPTARFAYGDFTIRRITSAQTGIASPYNTYYVNGLPPGPICTPSPKSIDAVLFAPRTTYLYFCANSDGSGTHLFASTYEDHLKNARAFHQSLNARGVH